MSTTTDKKWELRLATGKRVTWAGESGIEAARRYVDAHPGATIVAFRAAPQHGVFSVHPNQIVG